MNIGKDLDKFWKILTEITEILNIFHISLQTVSYKLVTQSAATRYNL